MCVGILIAVIWQLGSQVVSRFIVGGNYSAYGVVGSFIAMMLWVYYASILLLLGAQMVQVLGHPNYNNNNGNNKSAAPSTDGTAAVAASPPAPTAASNPAKAPQ